MTSLGNSDGGCAQCAKGSGSSRAGGELVSKVRWVIFTPGKTKEEESVGAGTTLGRILDGRTGDLAVERGGGGGGAGVSARTPRRDSGRRLPVDPRDLLRRSETRDSKYR